MIAIVDYGMGNLRSVSKAFEAIGAKAQATSNLNAIADAEAIILPGVGAFRRGMENLNELNVIPVIKEAVKSEIPIFGICLGLQLLFSESEEHGVHKGLDIISGRVKKFPGGLKVPHMGWNQVKKSAVHNVQQSTARIFENIPNNSYFYFVHSYYVEPEDEGAVLARTEYGVEFASCVAKGNILGVQFHPEKSSDLGLKILQNFCRNVG